MYKHILVPVSFDQDRDAKGAVETAKLLAADDTKITLIHVVEQIPGYAAAHLPKDFMDKQHEDMANALREMEADVPNSEVALVSGHAGRTLVDWSRDHGVDCIVIASHRPGMQDLLLGSTAAKVVRHAQCAVHVLR